MTGDSALRHRGKDKPIAVVAHPGTQSSLQVAAALARRGLLHRHLTGLYTGIGWAGRLLGRRLRRWHPDVPTERIRLRSGEELIAALAARLARHPETAKRALLWRNRRFGAWAGRIAARGARVLHGFETAALEAFRIARASGVACVLHAVSPPGEFTRRLHAREARRYPALADTLPRAADSQADRQRRRRELELADHVITYSAFMRRLLVAEGVLPEKVSVAPRSVRLDECWVPEAQMSRRRDLPFRAVFVGNLTQHKGLGYLLDAWRKLRLPDAELVLIGGRVGRGRWLLEQARFGVRHVGRVRHDELRTHLADAHVFVFPTLADGYGVVVPEAMAAGLPVIATSNCCAPELMRQGQDGFIVGAGDAASLAMRIEQLYRNRDLCLRMGRSAQQTARGLSADAFGQTIAEVTCRLAGLPAPETDRVPMEGLAA